MEFGLLDFLDGISPWWWITLGVVLIGLEMTTMSFFLIWPGIAAVVIAILLWMAPGMSGEAQVALFAVLSVAFTWVGRTIIVRTGQAESDKPALNRRSNQLVGRHATAVAAFRSGEGSVEIDGVRWKARCETAKVAEGVDVKIIGADGMTLLVELGEGS
jgi:membrane protein implicated in regulation of membrane protease activity